MRALTNAWMRASAAAIFAGGACAAASAAAAELATGVATPGVAAPSAASPIAASSAAVLTPAAPVALQPEKNMCPDRAEPVALGTALWNGWGRDLDNSRYQPEPAIRASDVGKLTLKWSFGYQGGGEYGQPTVVDGRLFLAGASGRIYSIDAKSGCTYWTFDAAAGSRTAISIAELGQSKRAVMPKRLKRTLAHLDVIKAPSVAVFGDDGGNVYALDAQRGTLVWKTQVEPHPLARIVGAPTLYNNRVFVSVGSTEEAMATSPGYACCTFRGSVAALDVVSGKLLWKSFTVLEEPQPTRKSSTGVQEFAPAGAAVMDAPTIDPKREVLYVGTGGSTTSVEQSLTDAVVAFDLNSGKLRWVKQLASTGEMGSSGFSSSPILRTLASGNQVILAGQRSGTLFALDPDHGAAVIWQVRVAQGTPATQAGAAPAGGAIAGGAIAWGMAADYKNVYVGLTGAGGLNAVEMRDGTLRWHAAAPTVACASGEGVCTHGQSQAVTVMPGGAFSGSLDGHLRAYSTIDGKVLWDFDTTQPLHPLNGVAARGGPLDRGGATIVNGMVYINSGNALLAFSTGSP
jgi:polyvinyl alcohol dehydrogenase (cytochrome)